MVTFHVDDADDGLGNHTPPPVNQDPPPPALQAASQGNETPRPDPPASGGPGANGPDEGVWVPPAETEAYLAWKREKRGKVPMRDPSPNHSAPGGQQGRRIPRVTPDRPQRSRP
mgnify:CR=1 FL=1